MQTYTRLADVPVDELYPGYNDYRKASRAARLATQRVSIKWNIPLGTALASGVVVSLLGGIAAGMATFGLVILSYVLWPKS